MEIAEIKAQLTIVQVLDQYNLVADKNNMLCCPFHNDKTPSLQIYPQINVFCCFSSNCNAGTGDVIELIRLMEKSTKHEAILKATNLVCAPILCSWNWKHSQTYWKRTARNKVRRKKNLRHNPCKCHCTCRTSAKNF